MQPAQRTTLRNITGNPNTQYALFPGQRFYDWEEDLWARLWRALTSITTGGKKCHWMGTLRTKPLEEGPQNIQCYEISDGQQRITTLTIFLIVLRDLAEEHGHEDTSFIRLATRINDQYIINCYEEGEKKYRILPRISSSDSINDRVNLISLIENKEPHPESQILKAYRYFHSKVCEDSIDHSALETLFNAVQCLSFDIGTPDDDADHYAEFGEANGSIKRLTDFDLARNAIHGKIKNRRIADAKIDPIEVILNETKPAHRLRLGMDHMTEFLRHAVTKDLRKRINRDAIFTHFETHILDNRSSPEEVISYMDDLLVTARHYQRLQDPTKEPDERVRSGISRLNRLELSVAIPFMLNVYQDYELKTLDVEEVLGVLAALENFTLRRWACESSSNNLPALFANLHRNAVDRSVRSGCSFVQAVRELLADHKYPTDEEVISALITKHIYHGEAKVRARIILESIEVWYGHKEVANLLSKLLSLDHILPQTLTQWWIDHLGTEVYNIHRDLLDTLGNLTLTGYNSEGSNHPFPWKVQEVYAPSNLQLNKDIAQEVEWKDVQIRARSKRLAEIVCSIWPDMKPNREAVARPSLKGQQPHQLTVLGIRREVSSWNDVLDITLDEISKQLSPDEFERLAKDIQRDSNKWKLSRSHDNMKDPQKLRNGYYYPRPRFNADRVEGLCRRLIRSMGGTMDDWHIELEVDYRSQAQDLLDYVGGLSEQSS